METSFRDGSDGRGDRFAVGAAKKVSSHAGGHDTFERVVVLPRTQSQNVGLGSKAMRQTRQLSEIVADRGHIHNDDVWLKTIGQLDDTFEPRIDRQDFDIDLILLSKQTGEAFRKAGFVSDQ